MLSAGLLQLLRQALDGSGYSTQYTNNLIRLVVHDYLSRHPSGLVDRHGRSLPLSSISTGNELCARKLRSLQERVRKQPPAKLDAMLEEFRSTKNKDSQPA